MKTLYYKFFSTLMLCMALFVMPINEVLAQCSACAAGTTSTDLNPLFQEGFSNGSSAGDGTFALDQGTDGVFAGTIISIDALPAGVALTDICMTGDFEVVSAQDFSGAPPIVVEFRIENVANGAQRIDFNVPIGAAGAFSIADVLANGTNAGFDASQPAQIVWAIANFSGTVLPEDITVNYSNVSLTACVPDVVEPPATCAPCPDGTTSTSLNPTFQEGFSNGSAAGDGSFGLDQGTDGVFAGTIISIDALPAGVALTDICMTGDFEVVSAQDFSAPPPIVVEFRIENVANGAQRIEFNTTIGAAGSFSIADVLANGTNAGFDATQPAQIVWAIANFSGTVLPEDITVNYSNVSLTACVPDVVEPPAGCAACPAGTVAESLNPVFNTGFNGSPLSFANNGAFGLNQGADNDFAGIVIDVDDLPIDDLSQICLSGDFTVTSDVDFGAYPINLEIRIENVGAGGQRVVFDTPITGAGMINISDVLANGTNMGFDPTAPIQIVLALANNQGGIPPAPDLIAINYANISLTACVEEQPATCAACPEGTVAESLNPVFVTPFQSGANSGATDGSLFFLAGAFEDFAGSVYTLDAFPTTDLSLLCITADFDVTSSNDFAAFPFTLEMRLENIGTANKLEFNTALTGSGSFSVTDLFANGVNTNFDPTLPTQLVFAANTGSQGPLPADINITYSNFDVTACVGTPVCAITNVSAVPSICDADTDTYSLTVDFDITTPGASGAFNMDICGQAVGPIPYSALPLTISNLPSDGAAACTVTVTDADSGTGGGMVGTALYVSFTPDGISAGGGLDECLEEIVTIHNFSNDADGCVDADISGFMLMDNNDVIHTFPAGTTIPAGGTLSINVNDMDVNAPDGCDGGGSKFANGGDNVQLLDVASAIVDDTGTQDGDPGDVFESPALIAAGGAGSANCGTACTGSVDYDAPATCVVNCSITAAASNVVCSDNDTPNDATDDTYTFDVTVTAVSDAAATYTDDQGNANVAYGTVTAYGPFPITGGDVIVTATDDVTGTCTAAATATAPAPCSVLVDCTLTATVVSAVCDDVTFGTDTYTVTVDFDNGAEGAPGAGGYTITPAFAGDNPMVDATGTMTFTVPEGGNFALSIVSTAPDGVCDVSATATDPGCDPLATITNMDPSISDPCTCEGPEGTTPAPLFYEEVLVLSGPGETWTYTSTGSAGLVDLAGAALADGSPMTEGPAGSYLIGFYHIDGVGYNGNFTNGTSTLSSTNVCAYPEVSITNLPSLTCAQAAPYTLTADDATATFTIDDAAATVFDPAALGAGTYTVEASTVSDVGCAATSTTIVEVLADCGDLSGCTDPAFCEYDPTSIIDDGSCATTTADPGTCDDGDCSNGVEVWDFSSCECVSIPAEDENFGCTDPSAWNYNADALCDDGSCIVLGSGACHGLERVCDGNDLFIVPNPANLPVAPTVTWYNTADLSTPVAVGGLSYSPTEAGTYTAIVYDASDDTFTPVCNDFVVDEVNNCLGCWEKQKAGGE